MDNLYERIYEVVVVRKKKIDKIFFSTETDSIPRNW